MADFVNWEWEMMMNEEAILSDFISAPLRVEPMQMQVQVHENNTTTANNNNINQDHDLDLDHHQVDLARQSETPKSGSRVRRRYSRNTRVKPSLCQPRIQRTPIVAPPTPPPRVINQLMTRFLFKKQLHNSDVSAAGRIVIPKKACEMHLPPLEAKEGIWLHMNDMDLFRVWPLKLRFWPNNGSRMYIFENTKEFISTHALTANDYIMVYKDDETGSYVIRAKKSVPLLGMLNIPATYNFNTNYLQNPNSIIYNNPAVNIQYDSLHPNYNIGGNGNDNNNNNANTNIIINDIDGNGNNNNNNNNNNTNTNTSIIINNNTSTANTNNNNANNILNGNPMDPDQLNGGSALGQPSSFGQVLDDIGDEFLNFKFDDYSDIFG